MNKHEFLMILREELTKLPPEEIFDAIEYFEECFAEATDGLDEKAARAEEERLIREFGNPRRVAAQIKADYASRLLDGDESVIDKNPGTKKKLSAIWWIIIGICSAPIAVPLVIALIAIIFAILVCVVCCILGGVMAIVFGFIGLGTSLASGILTIGTGLMLLAVSLAAGALSIMGIGALTRSISGNMRASKERRSEAGTNDTGTNDIVDFVTIEEGGNLHD